MDWSDLLYQIGLAVSGAIAGWFLKQKKEK